MRDAFDKNSKLILVFPNHQTGLILAIWSLLYFLIPILLFLCIQMFINEFDVYYDLVIFIKIKFGTTLILFLIANWFKNQMRYGTDNFVTTFNDLLHKQESFQRILLCCVEVIQEVLGYIPLFNTLMTFILKICINLFCV